jgi:hypothetical protein
MCLPNVTFVSCIIRMHVVRQSASCRGLWFAQSCERGVVHGACWTCRYIFPGLALGAHLGDTKIVTDHMIMAVAEALPRMLSEKERKSRAVYPDLANIRNISAHMAVEVRPMIL